jgi:hypothetical protein
LTTGAGNSLVIAAGGDFLNSGSASLSAGSNTGADRWLVYSASPATINKGGLTSSFRHYSGTHGTYAPGSVAEGGSGFIYASAPGTLAVNTTLASGTASQIYGDAPTAGFGTALVGFADAEDTAGNIGLGGAATFTPLPSTTSNAGGYTIQYANGLTSGKGYAFSTGTGLGYTVNTRGLTVTADVQSMTYGNGVPTLTYTAGGLGLVNGDTLSGVLATTASPTANVGSYGITQNTLAASANYNLTYTPANVSIGQRGLTVTADAKTMTYGNAVPTLTYTAGGLGLVNGDTLSGVLATTASPTANVGSYGITQNTLAASANYNLTYTPANVSIGQRGLTVTADAQSMIYGDAVPTLTYTAGGPGLVNGDTLSGALAAAASNTTSVGSYPITQGSLAASSNYAVSYTGNNLGIAQRPSVTWTGGSSGLWSSAANWGGVLTYAANVGSVSIPGGTTVTFDAGAAATQLSNVSVGAGGSFVMAGSSLNVAGSLTTPNFNQTGGTLNGAGSLVVSNSFAKSGGSLALTGLIHIHQASGALNINNNAPLTLGAVETVNGNILVDTSGGIFTTASAVNANGGSLSFIAHSPITVGSGGVQATNGVSLAANTADSSSTITINGAVNGGTGPVTLSAYSSIVENAAISGSAVTRTILASNTSPPATTPAPVTNQIAATLQTVMDPPPPPSSPDPVVARPTSTSVAEPEGAPATATTTPTNAPAAGEPSSDTVAKTGDATTSKTEEKAQDKPAPKPAVRTVTVANNTVQKPADQVMQVERPKGRVLVCKG